MLTDLSEALAGCPELCALNAAGCIGLHALALTEHPLLTRLEVAGCKRMAALRCSSPTLQHCQAQSCGQLQARVFSSIALAL